MKYREIELELTNPTVRFDGDGFSIGKLTAWKSTPAYNTSYVLKFRNLTTAELACIAHSASEALQRKLEAERENLSELESYVREVWE